LGLLRPHPQFRSNGCANPIARNAKQYTGARTLKGPRALFSKINFLHGAQAKNYVSDAEFQGLSDAIIAF